MGLSENDVSHPFIIPYPYAIVSPIVSKPQLRFLNVSGCCAALTCLSCRGCHLPWLQENLREVEEMDVLGG